MTITRERFQQGLTYDEFKAQMTRNQDRFAANETPQIDPADLAVFRNLPQPLDVLALAEDWCGDVVDNLPILGYLARESGKLNLRVFPRDQNLDIMDQYLNKGEFRSIPVFAFFDEQFQEIGRFVERPTSVTERRSSRRAAIFAQHPEFGSPETPVSQLPEDIRTKLTEATAADRAATRAADVQDVVHELRAIVESAPARA
jgi:hypothetical protein